MSSMNSIYDNLEDIVTFTIPYSSGIQSPDSTEVNSGPSRAAVQPPEVTVAVPSQQVALNGPAPVPNAEASGHAEDHVNVNLGPSRAAVQPPEVTIVVPSQQGMLNGPALVPNAEASGHAKDHANVVETNSVDASKEEGQETPTNNPEDAAQAALLSKLSTTLTQLLKTATMGLKIRCESTEVLCPTPLAFRALDGTDNAIHTWEEGPFLLPPPEKKRKAQCQVMGEIPISLELPSGFFTDGIDIDKLNMILSGGEVIRRFSFPERLHGWLIQCKARPTGKLDIYYFYDKDKKTFRSIKEVVKFIMFEVYPNVPTPKNADYKDEGSSSQKRKVQKRSSDQSQ